MPVPPLAAMALRLASDDPTPMTNDLMLGLPLTPAAAMLAIEGMSVGGHSVGSPSVAKMTTAACDGCACFHVLACWMAPSRAGAVGVSVKGECILMELLSAFTCAAVSLAISTSALA